MITNRSLDIFQKAARDVPAYKSFLESNGIDASKIKNTEEFSQVPLITKKNYLQCYPKNDLIWNKAKEGPLWFCSTSGSTGEPYYFPRYDDLAERGAHFIEDFLKHSSYGQGRTLVLLGFGMGVWIGGIITLRSFEMAACKLNLPVSFLPTGYNKDQIFKALSKLSPDYDQTIIVGYPPFVKEIVDESEDQGINLKSLNLRFVFAAEAFTETFRNYVCENSGVGSPLLDTFNIYGSADIGAMACETPLSILVRKLAREDPLLYMDMFGQIEKTPTLAQYNPDFLEFEVLEGELLLTSDGALPLVRYAIGDNGGVYTYEEIERLFKRYGISLSAEIAKVNISKTVKHYPFVYVYERKDLSTTLHGILIYPEFIKEALLREELTPSFTERFAMSTKNDIHHNQFLQINLEMQKDVDSTPALQKKALGHIRKTLIDKSSEFAEISKSKESRKLIKVVLWPNGHKRYFTPDTKQKWVANDE